MFGGTMRPMKAMTPTSAPLSGNMRIATSRQSPAFLMLVAMAIVLLIYRNWRGIQSDYVNVMKW